MLTIFFNTPERSQMSNGVNAAGNPAPPAIVIQPFYQLRANYNYLASINTYKGYSDAQFLPANAAGPYTMAS